MEEQENQEKKEHHENHEHPEHHENHEKEHEHAHEKEGSEKEGGKAAFKRESAPPSGEKKDLRDSRVSILIFTLAGAAVALVSSILKSSGLPNYLTITIGFLVLVALLLGMQKAFRRRIKFFYASLFVYLLAWLVFWIFLYNM